MQTVASHNKGKLKEAVTSSGRRWASIEAEFGSEHLGIEDGAVVALSHHSGQGRQPSQEPNYTGKDTIELLAISHLDEDVIIGAMALMGKRPTSPEGDRFCRIISHADRFGLHRLDKFGEPVSEQDRINLAALESYVFQAESEKPIPSDSVADYTSELAGGISIVERILAHDPKIMAMGLEHLQRQERRERKTLVGQPEGGVLVRVGSNNMAGLYTYHQGDKRMNGKAIISFNTEDQSITLSTREEFPGIDCALYAKEFWGPLAGGHRSIAGSPRDQQMTFSQLCSAVTRFRAALVQVNPALAAGGAGGTDDK